MQTYDFNEITRNVFNVVEDHYQNDLPVSEWRALATWLYKTNKRMHIPTKGLVLALYLTNEVLARVKISRENLQLVSVCALYLAELQQEGYHSDVDDYLEMTSHAYTYEQFTEMLKKIILLFEGRIRPPTIYDVILSLQFDDITQYSYDASRMGLILVTYYPEFFAWDLQTLASACVGLAEDLNRDLPDVIIKKYRSEAYLLSQLVKVQIFPHMRKDIEAVTDLLDRLEVRKNFDFTYASPEKSATQRTFRSVIAEPVIDEDEIGSGSYGAVYIVKKNGAKFARKTQDLEEPALRELSILSTYQHENLITLFSFSFNEELHLDLELGRSLADLVQSIDSKRVQHWEEVFVQGQSGLFPVLPLAERRKYQTDLLKGFEYLHAHGIIHRDIKLANVVIVNGTAKIIDFGLAYSMCLSVYDDSRKDVEVYTTPQRPLELLWKPQESRDYAFEADLWAVGSVLLEMEVGLLPFYYRLPQYVTDDLQLGEFETIIWSISRILGSPPREGIYADFPYAHDFSGLRCVEDVAMREVILGMLLYEKRERLTTAEALEALL